MDNQIGDNNECKKCLGLFFTDCFYKLFDKKIMAVDRINLPFKKNTRLLIDLSPEQRKKVINSMGKILEYNPDFNEIGINYLLDLSKYQTVTILTNLLKANVDIIIIKQKLLKFERIKFKKSIDIFYQTIGYI